MDFIKPCFGIGHNLSLICQMTSEDIKHQLIRWTHETPAATVKQTTCLCRDTGGKGTLPAQHTIFNTLDNWAIKTPPNQKGKGPERKGYRVMARNMYTIHSVTYIIRYGVKRFGGGDSSVVRAPDSWLKGRGFESLLERRENFLLQGRLSVLTLISVSVPPPCYHSST